MASKTRAILGLKGDHILQSLRQAILFRDYPPGSQLLEQTLSRDLGCSQGTVREALLRLSEEGLVERRSYRGTVVTETTLDEVVEMVNVRLSIESAVAKRICSQGLGDNAGAIDTIFIEMDAAHRGGDLNRCSELDRIFHVELARAAGLQLLCPILRRCSLHIHRFTLGELEVPRRFFQEAGVGAEHRALLDAILSGTPSQAAAAMGEHIARVLIRWAPSIHAALGEEAFPAEDATHR